MNNTNLMIGAAAAIVLIGGGVFFFTQSNSPASPPTNQIATGNQANNQAGDQTGSATGQSVASDDSTSSARYIAYSPEAVQQAAEDGQAVLFFHANWCPTCRAADKDISANLSDIPDNVTIIKTDFDTETELKKKYQVVGQHTFVQIDANGELVTKWSGGGLDQILKRIKT